MAPSDSTLSPQSRKRKKSAEERKRENRQKVRKWLRWIKTDICKTALDDTFPPNFCTVECSIVCSVIDRIHEGSGERFVIILVLDRITKTEKQQAVPTILMS